MKVLISELIKRLVQEASSDASHKSYCDDELEKEDLQSWWRRIL